MVCVARKVRNDNILRNMRNYVRFRIEQKHTDVTRFFSIKVPGIQPIAAHPCSSSNQCSVVPPANWVLTLPNIAFLTMLCLVMSTRPTQQLPNSFQVYKYCHASHIDAVWLFDSATNSFNWSIIWLQFEPILIKPYSKKTRSQQLTLLWRLERER